MCEKERGRDKEYEGRRENDETKNIKKGTRMIETENMKRGERIGETN